MSFREALGLLESPYSLDNNKEKPDQGGTNRTLKKVFLWVSSRSDTFEIDFSI